MYETIGSKRIISCRDLALATYKDTRYVEDITRLDLVIASVDLAAEVLDKRATDDWANSLIVAALFAADLPAYMDYTTLKQHIEDSVVNAIEAQYRYRLANNCQEFTQIMEALNRYRTAVSVILLRRMALTRLLLVACSKAPTKRKLHKLMNLLSVDGFKEIKQDLEYKEPFVATAVFPIYARYVEAARACTPALLAEYKMSRTTKTAPPKVVAVAEAT